jgi:hypothetical protein
MLITLLLCFFPTVIWPRLCGIMCCIVLLCYCVLVELGESNYNLVDLCGSLDWFLLIWLDFNH